MSITPPATTDVSDVQRNLWLTRMYYVFWYAALGFTSPFLNLFYVHLGLTGTQIGAIVSVGSVVALAAAPFWANRNDRWRNPRTVLQCLLFCTGLSYLWLSQQMLFWGIVLVSIFQAVVSAGVPPLSDSLALRVTESTKSGYGSIRVYGSLGWMLFVPLSGWVVEHSELKNSLVGSGMFWILAAVILFSVHGRHFAAQGQQTRASIRDVIGKLRRNPVMIGTALMIVWMGLAGTGAYQFQGVYLGELGASGTIIGIAGMISALVELPFMFWADRLTTKWGAQRVLLLGMLIFAGSRLAVFLLPSIPLIIVAEGTMGIAFSFYTVALVRFIAQQTDAHETRTVLALYTVTLTSLLGIFSGPLAGSAFDHLGARSLYLIAALGYALAWTSLYVANRLRTPDLHPDNA